MSKELDGYVTIVTGSTSGIGEQVARRMSALGASIVVNSATSVDAGEALAAELGNSIYVQADISDPESCLRLINTTVEQYGGLDCLVNNAGWTTVVPQTDLDGLTDEIFDRTFQVNVYGTWQLTKAAIPHLKKSDNGNVISVTSIAGVAQLGSSIAYSMSKAALNHMTKLLAKSHGPVRFNAVAPGLVDTPWTKEWTDIHAHVASVNPVPRSATPDDCAEAVLSFVRNRYTTGQILVVDGGTILL